MKIKRYPTRDEFNDIMDTWGDEVKELSNTKIKVSKAEFDALLAVANKIVEDLQHLSTDIPRVKRLSWVTESIERYRPYIHEDNTIVFKRLYEIMYE